MKKFLFLVFALVICSVSVLGSIIASGPPSVPATLNTSSLNATIFNHKVALKMTWNGGVLEAYDYLLNPQNLDEVLSDRVEWEVRKLNPNTQKVNPLDTSSNTFSVCTISGGVCYQRHLVLEDGSNFTVRYILRNDQALKYNLTLKAGENKNYSLRYRVKGITDESKSESSQKKANLKIGSFDVEYDYSDVLESLGINEILNTTTIPTNYFNEIQLGLLSVGQTVQVDPVVIASLRYITDEASASSITMDSNARLHVCGYHNAAPRNITLFNSSASFAKWTKLVNQIAAPATQGDVSCGVRSGQNHIITVWFGGSGANNQRINYSIHSNTGSVVQAVTTIDNFATSGAVSQLASVTNRTNVTWVFWNSGTRINYTTINAAGTAAAQSNFVASQLENVVSISSAFDDNNSLYLTWTTNNPPHLNFTWDLGTTKTRLYASGGSIENARHDPKIIPDPESNRIMVIFSNRIAANNFRPFAVLYNGTGWEAAFNRSVGLTKRQNQWGIGGVWKDGVFYYFILGNNSLNITMQNYTASTEVWSAPEVVVSQRATANAMYSAEVRHDMFPIGSRMENRTIVDIIFEDANANDLNYTNYSLPAGNTAPTITRPLFDQATFYRNVSIKGNTTIVDVDVENVVVHFNWTIGSTTTVLRYRNYTISATASAKTANDTLTGLNFTEGQNVTLRVWGEESDGGATTATQNDSAIGANQRPGFHTGISRNDTTLYGIENVMASVRVNDTDTGDSGSLIAHFNWTRGATQVRYRNYTGLSAGVVRNDTLTQGNFSKNQTLRVSAWVEDEALSSHYSNVTFTVQNITINRVGLVAPNASTIISANTYSIDWNAATNPTYAETTITYITQYSTNGGTSWTALATGTSDTNKTWDVTSLNYGETYQVRVRAEDDTGYSVYNTSASFTIGQNTTTVENNSVRLTSNSTTPSIAFGHNVTFRVDAIAGFKTTLQRVNFTLFTPDGVIARGPTNGTDTAVGNFWNSSFTYLINNTGTWTYEVRARNDQGNITKENFTFSVGSFDFNISPQTFEYAVPQDNKKNNFSFLVSFQHNSPATHYYNLSYALSSGLNTTYFNTTFNTTNNFNISGGQKRIVNVTITSAPGVVNNIYNATLKLYRIADNRSWDVNLSIGVDPPAGRIVAYDTNGVVCAETGTDVCDLTTTQGTGSTFSKTLRFKNEGNWSLTKCNARLEGGLENASVSFGNTNFELTVGSTLDVSVDITGLTTGVYEGYVNTECVASFAGLYNSTLSGGNQPRFALEVSGASSGGGGGGSDVQEPAQVVVGNISYTMQNDRGGGFYEIGILQGRTRTKPVIIKNTGSIDVNMNLACSDVTIGVCKWVSLDVKSFALKPSEEKTVQMTVSVPDDVTKGEYKFNLLGTVQEEPKAKLTFSTTIQVGGLLQNLVGKLTESFIIPGNKAKGGPDLKIPFWTILVFSFIVSFAGLTVLTKRFGANPNVGMALSGVLGLVFSVLIIAIL